jgi:hypothetical protein
VLFPEAQAASLGDLSKVDGIGRRISCLCMLSHAVYQSELADYLIAQIRRWQDVTTDMSKCREHLIPRLDRETYERTDGAERVAKTKLDNAEWDLETPARLEKAIADARSLLAGEMNEADDRLAKAQAALAEADPKTPELEKRVRDAVSAQAFVKRRGEGRIARAEADLKAAETRKPEFENAATEARKLYSEAEKAASSPKYHWKKKNEVLDKAEKACRFAG